MRNFKLNPVKIDGKPIVKRGRPSKKQADQTKRRVDLINDLKIKTPEPDQEHEKTQQVPKPEKTVQPSSLDDLINDAKNANAEREKTAKTPEPDNNPEAFTVPNMEFLVEIIDNLQSEFCATLAAKHNKKPAEFFKMDNAHRQQLNRVLVDTAPKALLWFASNPYGRAIAFFGALGFTQMQKIKAIGPEQPVQNDVNKETVKQPGGKIDVNAILNNKNGVAKD